MTVLPNFNHTLTMAFIVLNGSYLVKVISPGYLEEKRIVDSHYPEILQVCVEAGYP